MRSLSNDFILIRLALTGCYAGIGGGGEEGESE